MNLRLLLSFSIGLCLWGCTESGDSAGADSPRAAAAQREITRPSSGPVSGAPTALSRDVDQRVSATQDELLEIAFATASATPHVPHHKWRARFQEHVARTCLELDLPGRAYEYASQIDNWRRGTALADIAFYCVENEVAADVQRLLDEASQIADDHVENSQDPQPWRRDRVRSKIAATYALMGKTRQVELFEQELEPSELGRSALAGALQLDGEEGGESAVEELRAVFAAAGLDAGKNYYQTIIETYRRLPTKEALRRELVDFVLGAQAIPRPDRWAMLLEFGKIHAGEGDLNGGAGIASVVEDEVEQADPGMQSAVPVRAWLASTFALCERADRAKLNAGKSLLAFEQGSEAVPSMFRPELLLPLGQAYHDLGESSRALAVYRRALQEGSQNPNSRVRAEDLHQLCCAIALSGFEPGDDLLARIRDARSNLGDPW